MKANVNRLPIVVGGKKTLISNFIYRLIIVSLIFILTMFLKPVRIIGQVVVFIFLFRASVFVRALKRSKLLMICISLPIILSVRLLVQLFQDDGLNWNLAVRQLSYYVFLVVGVCALFFAFRKYGEKLLSLGIFLASFVEYLILANFADAKFAGDYQIRGSFEGGTTFFFMSVVFLLYRSKRNLILAIFLFAAFSVFTHAAQGVLVSVLFFLILILPRFLKKLLIISVGSLPYILPVMIILFFDVFNFVDGNVNFRYNLWTYTLSVLQENGDVFGIGFGFPLYKFISSASGNVYYNFKNIENIGLHNSILQLTAYSGFVGLFFGFFLTFFQTKIAIKWFSDARVQAAFIVSSVSLANNQAISHFAVAMGLYLVIGLLIYVEVYGPNGLSRYEQVADSDLVNEDKNIQSE